MAPILCIKGKTTFDIEQFCLTELGLFSERTFQNFTSLYQFISRKSVSKSSNFPQDLETFSRGSNFTNGHCFGPVGDMAQRFVVTHKYV
jgi:hypothetical protein